VSNAAATAGAVERTRAEIDPAKIESEKRRERGDLIVARIA